jgi:hypothetical protein
MQASKLATIPAEPTFDLDRLFVLSSAVVEAMQEYPSQLALWTRKYKLVKAQQQEVRKQWAALQSRVGGVSRKAAKAHAQLDQLQAEMGQVDQEAAAVLVAQQPTAPVRHLQLFGEAMYRFAPMLLHTTSVATCGNPSCNSLATVSESHALVRGQQCVCRGCVRHGLGPTTAKR